MLLQDLFVAVVAVVAVDTAGMDMGFEHNIAVVVAVDKHTVKDTVVEDIDDRLVSLDLSYHIQQSLLG